jgi:hypothetical protein
MKCLDALCVAGIHINRCIRCLHQQENRAAEGRGTEGKGRENRSFWVVLVSSVFETVL